MPNQSEFRRRRSEQAQQLWLGRSILVVAVVAAIALTTLLFAFVPIIGSTGFCVIAVLLTGGLQFGLRKLLRYNHQKASLRHLRPGTQDEPVYSSPRNDE
jgi:hypothetical protein